MPMDLKYKIQSQLRQQLLAHLASDKIEQAAPKHTHVAIFEYVKIYLP
jgi:hypothetical protein